MRADAAAVPPAQAIAPAAPPVSDTVALLSWPALLAGDTALPPGAVAALSGVSAPPVATAPRARASATGAAAGVAPGAAPGAAAAAAAAALGGGPPRVHASVAVGSAPIASRSAASCCGKDAAAHAACKRHRR
jgi:hypothetical protein